MKYRTFTNLCLKNQITQTHAFKNSIILIDGVFFQVTKKSSFIVHSLNEL